MFFNLDYRVQNTKSKRLAANKVADEQNADGQEKLRGIDTQSTQSRRDLRKYCSRRRATPQRSLIETDLEWL